MIFLNISFQSMELGLIGVGGLPAVNRVELVLKNVLEAVRNQRPDMAGNLAQEQRGKSKIVTSISVLVRNEMK